MSPSDDPRNTPNPARTPVNRRLFLKGSSATIASAGVAAPAMAQEATPGATPQAAETEPAIAIEFFNPDEAAMVEALAARLMPGTPDDPGAREAGVVYYIDSTLAGTNEGYSKKTYTHGPFLNVTEEQADVEATSRTDIYQVVQVLGDQVSRYGYQSVLTPQNLYRRGLESLAGFAQSDYGAPFVELSESQQDEIIAALEADEATGFDAPSGSAFFTMLRNDTIEGMFSDPIYGGNRDMAGWRLIGYPGARGFYTAEEMNNPEFSAEPVSLEAMRGNGHSH